MKRVYGFLKFRFGFVEQGMRPVMAAWMILAAIILIGEIF